MFRSRIEGLNRLSEVAVRVMDETALNEVLLKSGQSIIDAAQANLEDGIPPDTRSGALAASLFAEISPDGDVRIGTPLEHGWHLEMGTLTRPAYPWLTAALADQRDSIARQIGEWLAISAKRNSMKDRQ